MWEVFLQHPVVNAFKYCEQKASGYGRRKTILLISIVELSMRNHLAS